LNLPHHRRLAVEALSFLWQLVVSQSTPFEISQNYITTGVSVVAKSALQQKISN